MAAIMLSMITHTILDYLLERMGLSWELQT